MSYILSVASWQAQSIDVNMEYIEEEFDKAVSVLEQILVDMFSNKEYKEQISVNEGDAYVDY